MKPGAPSILPTRMERVLHQAMEEVLGSEAEIVLGLSGMIREGKKASTTGGKGWITLDLLGKLQVAFEQAFGLQAGRGLCLQVGRACVKYGLREFGAELGISSLDFRLLPLTSRIQAGSEALAELCNRELGTQITFEVNEKDFTWHMGGCPLCRGRQADTPCCHLAVGLLQEAANARNTACAQL